MAPKPKLDNLQTRRRVLDGIRMKLTLRLASMRAGIAYDTFNEYRKTHPDFDASVDMAVAARAERWMKTIDRAEKEGDVDKAADRALEMLARCHPEEYGRKDTHKLIGGDQDQPAIQIRGVIDHRTSVAALAPEPVGDSDPPR